MKSKILLIIVGVALGAIVMSLAPETHMGSTAEEMVEHSIENSRSIDSDELMELMTSDEIYTVVDVRQATEHYYGYIPGSVLLPRGSLEFRIGSQEFWDSQGLYKPENNEKIILYCKKGSRSALAAHTLQDLGYSNVYWLEGGWKDWELTFPDNCEKNLEALGGQDTEEVGGC